MNRPQLVTQSKTVTDAFAKVLEHAAQYPNMRPEDIRALFLSVYINCSPRGWKRSAVA